MLYMDTESEDNLYKLRLLELYPRSEATALQVKVYAICSWFLHSEYCE